MSLEYELLNATSQNNLPKVKSLLEKGVNVNFQEKSFGFSPLTNACHDDKIEVLQLLIEAGANLNIQTRTGWTPLHYAVQSQQRKVFDILVNAGADINTKDVEGDTPLIKACCSLNEKIWVPLVLQAGADVNCQDNRGCTPLIWVISRCMDFRKKNIGALVDLLLDSGANVHLRTKKGHTVLYNVTFYIEQTGIMEIAYKLFLAGAEIEDSIYTDFPEKAKKLERYRSKRTRQSLLLFRYSDF